MLDEFKSRKGVRKFLDRVRLSGLTIKDTLRKNRENTKAAFKSVFKNAVMNDTPVERLVERMASVVKTRKRQTLNTIKNVMSGIRGEAKGIKATRVTGTWYNNGVLDGRTTKICMSYMDSSWRLPYSQIPDKPPRIAETPHPCRSFLTFTEDGGQEPSKKSFDEEFRDDEVRRELLTPEQYRKVQRGDVVINTFSDFEREILNDEALPKSAKASNTSAVKKAAAAKKPEAKKKSAEKKKATAKREKFLEKSKPVPVVPKKPTKKTETIPAKDTGEKPKGKPPKEKKLSREEIGMIEWYKGDGFYENNRRLLNPEKYSDMQVESARSFADKMDAIIGKSTAQDDLTVWRGIRSEELYKNAESLVGKSLPNRTVQSTTAKRNVAEDFAGALGELSMEKGTSVMMKIRIKKGSSALAPGAFTTINAAEAEVLLKANSAYRIVGVEQLGDVKVIEAIYEDFE